VKVVRVEWRDSTTVDMGWGTIDEYREHAYPDIILSVGFIVVDEPDCVMLAQGWKQKSKHRENEAITDCLVIPRADILSVDELRVR
jgi:hypothetical protein